MYPGDFLHLIAEQLTYAMRRHCDQRTKDQDARRKELQLYAKLLDCVTGHVLTSSLTAKASCTDRGSDSMMMGDCARTPDSCRCDYREHDDAETRESEEAMLETALSGLQMPPGLDMGNRIPKKVWMELSPRIQYLIRNAGRRRRAAARRARLRQCERKQQLPHPWAYPQAEALVDAMRTHLFHPHV